MPKKPDPATVHLVADLVLAGLAPPQIRTYLDRELGDDAPDQAALEGQYLPAALAELAAQAEAYRDRADDLAVVRLNDLYARSIQAQDLRSALDVQKALDRRLGAGTPAGKGEPETPSKPTPAPGTAGPWDFQTALGEGR